MRGDTNKTVLQVDVSIKHVEGRQGERFSQVILQGNPNSQLLLNLENRPMWKMRRKEIQSFFRDWSDSVVSYQWLDEDSLSLFPRQMNGECASRLFDLANLIVFTDGRMEKENDNDTVTDDNANSCGGDDCNHMAGDGELERSLSSNMFRSHNFWKYVTLPPNGSLTVSLPPSESERDVIFSASEIKTNGKPSAESWD